MTFHDFRACASRDLPVDLDLHERMLWVRTPEGTLHGGFDAVLELLVTIRGGRWLASVAGLPPLRWFGRWLYSLVARHRPRGPARNPHSASNRE